MRKVGLPRMSRNYEQHPECFPPVAPRDYDPDADGWKADALAEQKASEVEELAVRPDARMLD